MKDRYVGESGRLIYDALETANILKKKWKIPSYSRYFGFGFGLPDQSFLLIVLQSYGFWERFLKWI